MRSTLESPSHADTNVLSSAPEGFRWPTDLERPYTLIENTVHEFLQQHSFASSLAARMETEASVRFFDFVDHITLPHDSPLLPELQKEGYTFDPAPRAPSGTTSLWHPHAHLPRILLAPQKEVDIALKVEFTEDFLHAHNIVEPIEGAPFAPYRRAALREDGGTLFVVERHGSRDYLSTPHGDETRYFQAKEKWFDRPRSFSTERTQEGMAETLRCAKELSQEFGVGLAADAAFSTEREYWQEKNRAGQVQKHRQDTLGLGWANHDHHTFRSSRESFRALIQIFLALGFKKRERYYAGDKAGWGAQILEHPTAGLVIFADVDLARDEATVEFSRDPLSLRNTFGTVGLWCALHGESILQGGMHHLEAQFSFKKLEEDLGGRGIPMMSAFSNFPFLKQAFMKGEPWPVDHRRLEHLRTIGAITEDQAEKFLREGAIGSHLENLQRRGYKGFNKIGVDDIISRVDPRRIAAIERT